MYFMMSLYIIKIKQTGNEIFLDINLNALKAFVNYPFQKKHSWNIFKGYSFFLYTKGEGRKIDIWPMKSSD